MIYLCDPYNKSKITLPVSFQEKIWKLLGNNWSNKTKKQGIAHTTKKLHFNFRDFIGHRDIKHI